ncbi:oxidoreductase [Lacinutrix sp. Bg11-31]|uniref:WD40/YVTN/BNR-like repeat-containing protein n=1 Tax=Lacinutrix sp. Bg11-31 TaxID=2057808 RepID=UPI000C30E9D4|nr:oxidoreductase [Lacinutrix sp. Bg11-31]AUC80991.1 oxidoreductase [Lacinutrix sp. Bg11-31]
MKKLLITLGIAVSLFSCKKDEAKKEVVFTPRNISEVEIGVLLKDSTLNVRAIEKVKGYEGLFFLTSTGKGGMIGEDEIVFPIEIDNDNEKLNFRAFASTNEAGFALSVASPAYLYKIGENETSIVYQEDHEKAFYDAMAFWNDKEGIAIGDPTDSCLSIIITRDGGNTWNKLSCDTLPEAIKDEAAFAASDTNIAIVGDETWVATGGGASRIMYSPDKGETWEVFNTPIVQGNGPQGMYSLDFYDNKNGFAIGGDYTKPADSSANKIRTADGGKTWQLVAQNQNPGYRSCVQYIPGREAKELVAIGFKGIDYSNDAGDSWKHLSDEGFYTLRFVNDSVAYAAGSKRIAKLIFR